MIVKMQKSLKHKKSKADEFNQKCYMVHYKIYAVDNQHKLGKDKIDEETARGQTFY